MAKRDPDAKQKKKNSTAKKPAPPMKDFVVSQAFVVNEHLIDGPDDIDIFEDDQT